MPSPFCRDCGKSRDEVGFVKAKSLCLSCHKVRMAPYAEAKAAKQRRLREERAAAKAQEALTPRPTPKTRMPQRANKPETTALRLAHGDIGGHQVKQLPPLPEDTFRDAVLKVAKGQQAELAAKMVSMALAGDTSMMKYVAEMISGGEAQGETRLARTLRDLRDFRVAELARARADVADAREDSGDGEHSPEPPADSASSWTPSDREASDDGGGVGGRPEWKDDADGSGRAYLRAVD